MVLEPNPASNATNQISLSSPHARFFFQPSARPLQKVKSRGATTSEDLALDSGTAGNDKSLFPITDSGRPVTKESHEGFLNERDLQRTATKQAGTTVAGGAGTLGSIPPFGDQQPWQAPPFQPGSGAGAETPDLGKAEREAMEKSSLIYARDISANSGGVQAREIRDPAPEPGLGLVRDCAHAWNQRPARRCELRSWR